MSKPFTAAFDKIRDVEPSFTFRKDDDNVKKAVADHWDTFCGYPDGCFGATDDNMPNFINEASDNQTESDRAAAA